MHYLEWLQRTRHMNNDQRSRFFDSLDDENQTERRTGEGRSEAKVPRGIEPSGDKAETEDNEMTEAQQAYQEDVQQRSIMSRKSITTTSKYPADITADKSYTKPSEVVTFRQFISYERLKTLPDKERYEYMRDWRSRHNWKEIVQNTGAEYFQITSMYSSLKKRMGIEPEARIARFKPEPIEQPQPIADVMTAITQSIGGRVVIDGVVYKVIVTLEREG